MNYVGLPPVAPGTVIVGDTNPVGMVGWFHKVPDSSWFQLNGQSLLKAAYPDLWAYAQGFLTADQTTNPGLYRDVDANNFALPNLSGMFIRGTGQVDANHVAAAIGVKQADQNVSHTHPQRGAGAPGGQTFMQAASTITGLQNFNATDVSGGTEARPINVALMPCVKALRTGLLPLGYAPASAAEQQAGLAADRFVTPAVQQAHKSAAKAWVNFNGTGVVAIRDSLNTSSITDNGTGDYTINWATPFADTNYCLAFAGGLIVATNGYYQYEDARITPRTASLVRIGTATTTTASDGPFVQVTAFARA